MMKPTKKIISTKKMQEMRDKNKIVYTMKEKESEETFICSHCGEEYELSDMELFSDEKICIDCFSEETLLCSHCESIIWASDNVGDDNTVLCDFCYDRYYTICECCNRVLSFEEAFCNEEEEVFCYDCYEEQSYTYINDYNYKPAPIFYGEGNRFYGVELEIEYGGKDNKHAERLISVANIKNESIYIKTDSSLTNGLEIVTHPMSLLYHQQNMPWSAITKQALKLGYLSHKSDTCGLHIHVNRNTFSTNLEEQEACIGRVLFFIERFWKELLRFSRRTEKQLIQWADRYGYKHCPKQILSDAKESNNKRYKCVNLTNYNTIEFRLFRGTLNKTTIIATLQLVHEICNIAITYSDLDLLSLSWFEFVEQLSPTSYPELIYYLKKQHLYLNDQIETGEEE